MKYSLTIFHLYTKVCFCIIGNAEYLKSCHQWLEEVNKSFFESIIILSCLSGVQLGRSVAAVAYA
jgi:hypothetical protein